MRTIKTIITVVFVILSIVLQAQNIEIKGRITTPDNQPIKNAVVIIPGADRSVQTNEAGEFKIEAPEKSTTINVTAEGFFEMTQPLNGRTDIEMVLISGDKSKYSDVLVLPFYQNTQKAQSTSANNISMKDLGKGLTVESALQGEVAGLKVINKSGMPGEGAYLNLRGVKTFLANSSPLIVINGVPYISDMEESPVIGGYSRGILSSYDINDIQNISVLKGADAAMFGSLGANGVIMIETNGTSSDDLDTKISFSGQYGLNWESNTLPVLGVDDYKNYLSDVGLTYYDDMEDMLDDFPFLKDDPDYYYNYLYNNNTDWQEEIYKPSIVTENLLRIEGGDAVAKYDISLGYMNNGGVVDNTKQDRYHTLINTNIMVNRKLELFTTVGLSYMQGTFQEQGLIEETNPVLVAYKKMPLLSPYKKDDDGNVLDEYATYRYGVSNPVAIVNTLEATTKQYNVNIRLGANYKINNNFTLSGLLGLFYNYDQEQVFIPGVTNQAIVALDNDLAENTVRAGVGENKNMFYKVNGYYSKVFDDIHKVNISGGIQVLTTNMEYDAGSGYNTASDYYSTLDYVESGTESFYGYIKEWNWANGYLHGDYTWKSLVKTSLNLSIDRSSATGTDADSKYAFLPSAGVTFSAKNTKALINSSFINKLDIRAEYGMTGNSRFSSNYGKNYYQSSPYQAISGIIRSNIPNTDLEWEKVKQLNLGFDLSVLKHRLSMSFDYYQNNASDLLLEQTKSSVFGSSAYYDNAGEIQNNGIELALNATLIQSKDFTWEVGGNISFINSEVKSLGNVTESITELSDGAELITKVGENPYCFYGLVAEGVYATSEEASAAGLSNWHGDAYEAGDVIFKNNNDDNEINDDDKEIIGSATPDFFGGFYTAFRYKNFSLSAEFSYSKGNEAYNAVRRSIESMNDFTNQSKAVLNRWQYEGQVTNMPRAVYDDPMENNTFSTRWIEDASYLKLRNVTFSYNFNKTLLKIFRSGTFYVTGENLYTWTDYLGLDPEFSYSYSDALQGVDYAKVAIPRTFKLGFNLKF